MGRQTARDVVATSHGHLWCNPVRSASDCVVFLRLCLPLSLAVPLNVATPLFTFCAAVAGPRIQLAGEAMCDDLNGYTHGALQSGKEAAARYLHGQGKGPDPSTVGALSLCNK